MANRASKGGAFERLFCKQLSRWWTRGKRDDIFWRTAGSGARATVRSQAGRSTYGACGDIGAIDPIGVPFTELITVEIKRGYPHATLHDLLDRSENAAKQQWEKWIEQASESSKQAGSPYWMIVHKRDQRDAIAVMKIDSMQVLLKVPVYPSFLTCGNNSDECVQAIKLDDWFFHVKPQTVMDLHRCSK